MRKILFVINLLTGLILAGCYLSPFISPEKFWYLSVAEMLTPYFLGIHLAWFLLWILLEKKKTVVFNLVLLLLGISSLMHFYSFHPQSKNPSADRQDISANDSTHIKVMTFNVKIFADKPKVTLAFIDSIRPDILCLQEAWEKPYDKLSPEISPIKYLQEKTGLQYVYFSPKVFNWRKDGFGQMIFSRFPIVEKGTVEIKSKGVNGCMYVDTEINGKIYRVYNIHLESVNFSKEQMDVMGVDDDNVRNTEGKQPAEKLFHGIVSKLKNTAVKRAWQTREVKKHLDKNKTPVIICCDLNSTPFSYVYRTISKNLTDNFYSCGSGIGNTYFAAPIPFRIDYIFSSPALKVSSCRVIPYKNSDHSPVVSIIELPK